MLQPADQQQLLAILGLWRPTVLLGMLPLLGLLLLASLHSAVDAAVHRLARDQAYLRQAGSCTATFQQRLLSAGSCVWLHCCLAQAADKVHLWPPCCSSVGGVQTWHSPGLIYACRLAVAFGPTLLAATVSWRPWPGMLPSLLRCTKTHSNMRRRP